MNENIVKMGPKDIIMFKLAHYFITEKNYNPIIMHGINDEIWLENLAEDYKVVRLVGHYIHNNEQLNYDKFKVNKIIKNIKRKTFSFKMDVLNIYIDLGDNVDLNKETDNSRNYFIKNVKDIKNAGIMEIFPDIIEKTNFEENGLELMVKITDDINKKNAKNSVEHMQVFEKKKPFITYGIIAICIIVFICMYIFGNGSYDNMTLIKFGANVDSLVKSGHFYRLITCAFLHIGIFHLIFNMYALYVIGPQVESFFGKTKFIIIYLISTISASLLSMVFNHNTICAGASGAIFGLLGCILYFGYHYRIYLGNVIKSQIVPIIILNLLLGFMISGVDNYAHIGGLVGGILATMAVGVPNKSTKSQIINGCVLLSIYIIFISYLAFFYKI